MCAKLEWYWICTLFTSPQESITQESMTPPQLVCVWVWGCVVLFTSHFITVKHLSYHKKAGTMISDLLTTFLLMFLYSLAMLKYSEYLHNKLTIDYVCLMNRPYRWIFSEPLPASMELLMTWPLLSKVLLLCGKTLLCNFVFLVLFPLESHHIG